MYPRPLQSREAPISADAVAASKSGAIASDQQSVVGVTQVVNKLTSKRGLTITLRNTTNATIENIPMFIGVFSTEEEQELPEGISFKGGSHKSFEAFQNYFAHTSTRAKGMRLSTTNAGTFESAELVFITVEPDGKRIEDRFPLMEYLRDIGGGEYARTVEIPEQELSPLFIPQQRMELSELPAGASITFFFPIKQWNAAQNMVDL